MVRKTVLTLAVGSVVWMGATGGCARTPDGARIRTGLPEERVVAKLGTPDAIKETVDGAVSWYPGTARPGPSPDGAERIYYYLGRGTAGYMIRVEDGRVDEVLTQPVSEEDKQTAADVRISGKPRLAQPAQTPPSPPPAPQAPAPAGGGS